MTGKHILTIPFSRFCDIMPKMKVAALIPYRTDPSKPRHEVIARVKKAASLADMTIMLNDRCLAPIWQRAMNIEAITISSKEAWNDYSNRLILLSRAACLGFEWVLWCDDDWEYCCEKADIQGMVANAIKTDDSALPIIGYTFRLREMWTKTEMRVDGIWGHKRRLGLQHNPLSKKTICFKSRHLRPLHALPESALGRVVDVGVNILHWGMHTPELRQARVQKYRELDPEEVYQPGIGYDYMLSETHIELKSIVSP